MRHSLLGFFSVLLALAVNAAPRAAHAAPPVAPKLELNCQSEDDGTLAHVFAPDQNGDYNGVSGTMSVNNYLKLSVSLQGLGPVTRAIRAGEVKICALHAVYNDTPQACAGFSTLFVRGNLTGLSLFGIAGIRDPEGLFCTLELR